MTTTTPTPSPSTPPLATRTPKHPDSPSWEQILEKYSPKNWAAVYKLRGRTYTNSKIPIVGKLDAEYGPGAAAEWMLTQMLGFFTDCADRDSERFHALVGFAEDFCTDCNALKLTDVMCFMSAYRTGRIGKQIYSSTDPRVLGQTFHTCFISAFRANRDAAIERHEATKRQEVREEGCITFEEYMRQSYHTVPITVLTYDAHTRLSTLCPRRFSQPKIASPADFRPYATTIYIPIEGHGLQDLEEMKRKGWLGDDAPSRRDDA